MAETPTVRIPLGTLNELMNSNERIQRRVDHLADRLLTIHGEVHEQRCRAVAETLRFLAGGWLAGDASDIEYLVEAATSIEGRHLDGTCPLCQEVECDGDCPLAPVRTIHVAQPTRENESFPEASGG